MRIAKKNLKKLMQLQHQIEKKSENKNTEVEVPEKDMNNPRKRAEILNNLRRKNFYQIKDNLLEAKPHNLLLNTEKDKDNCISWMGIVLDSKIVSSQESYILIGNLCTLYNQNEFKLFASHVWLRCQNISLFSFAKLYASIGEVLVGRSEIKFDKQNNCYTLGDTEIVNSGLLGVSGKNSEKQLQSDYDRKGDWVLCLKRSALEKKESVLNTDASSFTMTVKPSIYEHVGDRYLNEIMPYKDKDIPKKELRPSVEIKSIIVEARAKKLVNTCAHGIIRSYVVVTDLKNETNYEPIYTDSTDVHLPLQQIGKIIHKNAIISFSAKLQIVSSNKICKLFGIVNPKLVKNTGITLNLPLKASLRYGYVDYINLNHSPEMIQFDEWRKLAGISKLELVWDSTNSLMTANMIAYDQKVDPTKLSEVMRYIGFKNSGMENNNPIYDYDELKRQEKFRQVIDLMHKAPTTGYSLKELSVYLHTDRNMLSEYLRQNVDLTGIRKTGFQISLFDLRESLSRLVKTIYISADTKDVQQAIVEYHGEVSKIVILGRNYVRKTWLNQHQSGKNIQPKPKKRKVKPAPTLSNAFAKKSNENKYNPSRKTKAKRSKASVVPAKSKIIATLSLGQITQQVNQDLIDSRYYHRLTTGNIMTILDTFLKARPVKQLKIKTGKNYFTRPLYNAEIIEKLENVIKKCQWNIAKPKYYDSISAIQPVQERLNQLDVEIKAKPSMIKQWSKILGYPSEHYTYHDLGAITAYGAICSWGYKAFKLDDIAQLIYYATGDPNQEDLAQLEADIFASLKSLHIGYSRNLNIARHPWATTRGGFIKIIKHYFPKVSIGYINKENNPLPNMDQVLTELEMKKLMWTSHAVLANKLANTKDFSVIRNQIVTWMRNHRNLIDQHYYYKRSFIFLDSFAIKTISQALKRNKTTKRQRAEQLSLKNIKVESKTKSVPNQRIQEYMPVRLVARLLVGVTPEEISNYLNIATHQSTPIIGHYQLSNDGEYLLDKQGIEIVKGRFKCNSLNIEKHLNKPKNIQIKAKHKLRSEIQGQLTEKCILLIKTSDGEILYTDQFKNYDQAQAYLLSNNKQFISAYKNQKYSKQRHLINIRKIMDISPIEK